MLTHGYWLQLGANAIEYGGFTQDDVILSAAPVWYMDAMWHVTLALMAGRPARPPAAVLGVRLLAHGARERRDVLLLPGHDAGAPAQAAARSGARPRAPGALRPLLRDRAAAAPDVRGALGVSLARGLRNDRDRRRTHGAARGHGLGRLRIHGPRGGASRGTRRRPRHRYAGPARARRASCSSAAPA